jgi:hypothetical protein
MHPSYVRLFMKTSFTFLLLVPLAFSLAAVGQNSPQPQTPQSQPAPAAPPQKHKRSAGGDIGSGSGDIGKGAGKGAEGVGKGAGDLVTLHPVGAVGNVGKGAGKAGVGAAKGAGKIGKGTGRLIAKPFHHSKKAGSADAPQP